VSQRRYNPTATWAITNITDPAGLYGSNVGNTFMAGAQDTSGAVHFTNQAEQAGVVDTAWGWGTSFVDMNLDGAPDLYAVQGMRGYVADTSPHIASATSRLFLGHESGLRFSDAPSSGCNFPGDQRALIVFDYNRDGAPDLLITQVNGPTLLLQNETVGPHWLTIAPSGRNDAGIDARISVTAGGQTTTQVLLAGGSYLAGPPREAYCGLGLSSNADVVHIAWADGASSDLRNVRANQVLRVAHP
jgi:hypothetical protein